MPATHRFLLSGSQFQDVSREMEIAAWASRRPELSRTAKESGLSAHVDLAGWCLAAPAGRCDLA
ncbi:MAG: hypothetical protein AAGJ83_15800, partial [Planctomycetota bacterium]